ncbi:MAG TPA: glycosyltransferase family A protein [Fimbriimonadaceae bacterium]|nr:glycosyltransferase family 2 protein [Fimbriimonadaceae bacterium]HQU17487.1 glycosyltransferase family A protein [Fimbriimonadaceae bacterium]
MIVVATNNGHRFLPELIRSIEECGDGGHEVVIVDTQSSAPEAQEYLSTLAAYSGPLRLSVDQTPYKGYDTGAYLHAFRKLAADSYIFLQDSACPKEPGWTEAFTSRLTYGVGCVPWLTFPLQWDEEGQLEFIRQQYRTDRVPPLGVFGPMFAASRESLLKLDQMKLLDAIPSTKVEQQAMERGWPLAFFLGGFGIRPIHTMFSERKLRAGEYGVLSKRLPKRS